MKYNIRLLAMTAVVAGLAWNAQALPNVNGRPANAPERKLQLKTTAAACNPANATIDIDINNVRARLMTGGDMWWDIGTGEARYEIPKGSRKNSLFAGSVWIGGYDPQKNLKVAAQTYRQTGNDYWPGPLSAVQNTADQTSCSDWDRFWKVNSADIIEFRELVRTGQRPSAAKYDVIKEWPAAGNGAPSSTNPDRKGATGVSGNNLEILNSGRTYAPFVDVGGANNDPNTYDWDLGDYPDVRGDQFIWWVFNDAGNTKLESQTLSIGMEVQASAFAFASKDFLNDATFYNYRLINRGSQSLDSTYIATWTDADLGYAFDDYIGCDTTRSLGILYNGKSVDGSGQTNSYGTQVPMVGVDFFIGPKRRTFDSALGTYRIDTLGMAVFNYYNNDFSTIGNPTNGIQIYGYMTGTNKAGGHIQNDFGGTCTGYGPGPITNYVFPGDPGKGSSEWSECACNRVPFDRRFIHSSGPFTLEPGGVFNDVTIGVIWVSDAGGCPNTSFRKIRSADDQAQALFENNFRTIEGPEAPRLVIREMDRKLVFYLVNDSVSTNFQEKFGYDLSNQKYRVSSAKTRQYADSLYKFEGYRVFQLRHGEVKPSQIFDEQGNVNRDVALEVFQTDIRNGVDSIINYTQSTINAAVPDKAVKVIGKDSGIVHSFVLEQDQFSSSSDRRFVNYRNYYFVAIAYAYNNFAPFDPNRPDSTQETPYLESSHSAGQRPLQVAIAMPNPANGDMGTVLNSDYGSGVILKRLEGTGNGGNSLQMDPESEAEALSDNQAEQPTYLAGQGPVNVKVIDPRMVKPRNWEIYINGAISTTADSNKGIIPAQGSWKLVATDPTNQVSADTIYSERNLAIMNEQILERYGISVSVQQVRRPGDDQVNRNGYIGSSVSFMDASKPWLAGVNDAEQRDPRNWIRSGGNEESTTNPPPCNYDDNKRDTAIAIYEKLFENNTLMRGTWAPYSMAAVENGKPTSATPVFCGFGVAYSLSSQLGLETLPSVDVVFTSDKSKWTRVPVIELNEDSSVTEGKARKWTLRNHASWNLGIDANGLPTYATNPADRSMTWFPGYAINQETGERLNIVMGEDSYLAADHGNDLIWNPTSRILDEHFDPIFGGKHYVYVLSTKYDEGQQFVTRLKGSNFTILQAYQTMQWVGLPTLTPGFNLLSLRDGLIPTETRLRLRVDRPYNRYNPGLPALRNGGLPLYSFSTMNLAPKALSDAGNPFGDDKQALLDQIKVVPNPYYGNAGYEANRLDTRVRITNLPKRATISIYSLDGALIRRVEKDNPNTSYVDWDIRNAKGLPVASGMYLFHVQAEGIGETIVRWFGAMRPIDITTF